MARACCTHHHLQPCDVKLCFCTQSEPVRSLTNDTRIEHSICKKVGPAGISHITKETIPHHAQVEKAAAEHVSIKDPGIAEAHVSAPVWVRRAEEVEDDQVLDG